MTNGATIQAPMTLEYDLSTVFPKKPSLHHYFGLIRSITNSYEVMDVVMDG